MSTLSEVVSIELDSLRPHEEVIEDHFHQLVRQIAADGGIHTPILIDRKTGTILDGHHRVCVAKFLGFLTVPARLVDYVEDGSVTVESWAQGSSVSKEDVLLAARSGRLMPPKTSRHRFLPRAA